MKYRFGRTQAMASITDTAQPNFGTIVCKGGKGIAHAQQKHPDSEAPPLAPLRNSDFSGWVYLTLSEAKIEFKPIEPRNPWVDALGFELRRQVLVVLS